MLLSDKNSRINFNSFLWHSVFLALASNFMDVDTIIPSMLIKAGGNSIHLGVLTAIMLGGSSLFQLVFAGYLSNKSFKKKYLLIGINLRIVSLLSLAILFFYSTTLSGDLLIFFIFFLISIFSFSGSYANVSYIDILGKSIKENQRKKLFSIKQVIGSIGIFLSAMLVRELLNIYDFPENYSILFLGAGFLLAIASLGFWNIHEIPSTIDLKKNFLEFFKIIPGEIRKNSNLKYYLLIINSLGLGLSILPFFILFAKDNFGLTYKVIGNFLLLRTIGMLLAGLFLYKYSKQFQYKNLLRFSLILSTLLPLISLVLIEFPFYYQFIFIFSGIFFAVYRVAINGVLLEISTNDNRAIYAGISGAGNIMTTIFPLFAGWLIAILGYGIVYLFVSIGIAISFIFVNKLQCKPLNYYEEEQR